MKFYLKKVKLNNGGYDSTGRYWGVGQPLYWYEGTMQDSNIGTAEYTEDHIRADNRKHAKAKIVAKYPTAKFYQ